MPQPHTRLSDFQGNMAMAKEMERNKPAPVSRSGYEPVKRSNFNDLYSADYIGLMSNPAFKQFYDSLEAPEDKEALFSIRNSWFELQKSQYRLSFGKFKEEALKSFQSLGGSAFAQKPGFFNAVKRWLSGGSSYDPKEARTLFQNLQADQYDRSLETYNDLVKKAVGAWGVLNEKTGYITPGAAGMSAEVFFARDLIQYHYDDDGSENPNSYSQYQRNLLNAAKHYIQLSGANGQFTSSRASWHNYEGMSLEELGVSPESLGKMGNVYNRYLTELYLAIANELYSLGARLPNDGHGVTAEKLQDIVSQALKYKALTTRGTSRGSSFTQDSLQKNLAEWMEYKRAMERIESRSSQLTGLDWAEFMVAYCGGGDEKGTDKYWPWWEPDQNETERCYWKAIDMLRDWDIRMEDYEKRRAAGDITAQRPDRSDLDPEHKLEFDGRGNPAATGPMAGPSPARSMPKQEVGEVDWIGTGA